MIWTALVLGLTSSLHCVAMCGPLVSLAYGGGNNSAIVYHFGRILTYITLGILVGLLGRIVHLSGLQGAISIILGALIVLLTMFYSLSSAVSGFVQKVLVGPLMKLYSSANRQYGILAKGILGAVNGLLPCGMVYLALAGALLQPEVIDSAIFMALFGLGTLPSLLLTGWSIHRLDWLRSGYRPVVTVFMLLAGVALVLRGLGLGIPLLSPDIDMHNAAADAAMCFLIR